MAKCPKCGAGSEYIWEDNFWSGCNKCGWSASCENNVKIVPIVSRPTYEDDNVDDCLYPYYCVCSECKDDYDDDEEDYWFHWKNA